MPRHGFSIEADDHGLRDGIGHGARHLIEYSLHRQRWRWKKRSSIASTRISSATTRRISRSIRVPIRASLAALDRFAAAGWSFAVCTNKPEGLSRQLAHGTRPCRPLCRDLRRRHVPDPQARSARISSKRSRRPAGRRAARHGGDSRTDLDTARAAGVAFIGVTSAIRPCRWRTCSRTCLSTASTSSRRTLAARLLERTAGRLAPPAPSLDFNGMRLPIDGGRTGRLAQRESTRFTRVGSLVQSQYRPPSPSRKINDF